jgi:hypothetical protein
VHFVVCFDEKGRMMEASMVFVFRSQIVFFFSSGTFLTAKQDKTGTLGWVEEKMARATMTPISHGEVYINIIFVGTMHTFIVALP